ncbi:hypothetical protein DMH18_33650 [Streptomyces sp. WAC 06783]|uniref:hypothetical protein n=1 Tax=Streptomyces sp. WAC 06783 TaxID=2203211 RepID=UPI000F742926|nr:hypothetical protein [Streptomyces sp. WAC 06783]RSO04614.1 hypothetical protein DMH18_33650 [Streptomyces sp. WAC 06783]
MTYRSDVHFLELCNPPLIEQAGDEYRRLHALLASCEDDFRKAGRIDWQGQGREQYTTRLKEATALGEHLSEAFRRVGKALYAYAKAVADAKRHFENGRSTESRLAEVVSREGTPITPTARAAEPMRQWEDLRGTTGFLDWVAELFADPDEIREEADRYYNATSDSYADALRVETEARTHCVAEIRAAFQSLPDFRGGDFVDAVQLQGGVDALRRETKDAADDPLAQLFGTGAKTDAIPKVDPGVAVSPALLRIKLKTAGLEADGNYHWLPSDSDEERRKYISNNKHLLRNAARDAGLPPEMVAGIAWKEVEGDPSWVDDAATWGRGNLPFTEDPDLTSMGPMSIQVRRAAEVLGYDPQNLSDQQREEVTGALKDPAQNAYIAAEYLAQLKAESDFADVPPEKMTREQMQELAARYNGGPYYRSEGAQRYGSQFNEHVDQAKEALGQ